MKKHTASLKNLLLEGLEGITNVKTRTRVTKTKVKRKDKKTILVFK